MCVCTFILTSVITTQLWWCLRKLTVSEINPTHISPLHLIYLSILFTSLLWFLCTVYIYMCVCYCLRLFVCVCGCGVVLDWFKGGSCGKYDPQYIYTQIQHTHTSLAAGTKQEVVFNLPWPLLLVTHTT